MYKQLLKMKIHPNRTLHNAVFVLKLNCLYFYVFKLKDCIVFFCLLPYCMISSSLQFGNEAFICTILNTLVDLNVSPAWTGVAPTILYSSPEARKGKRAELKLNCKLNAE